MTRYWAVRVGEGGKYADIARKHGFVAIEWHDLGDLLWLPQVPDDKDAQTRLLAEYQPAYGVTGIKAGIGAGQVRRFVREIQDGDVVLLPHTARGLIFVGRIQGDYTYVEKPTDGCPYRQRRRVEWPRTSAAPMSLPGSWHPSTP